MILILGAGLAGLSASYHLGHDRCLLLERNANAFGHIRSEQRDGFTWDQGPHVSFTKNDYVRDLFESSVKGEFEDIGAQVGNYFHGHWIAHPAQTSLHQVPEPIRTNCLASFLQTRDCTNSTVQPTDYQDWIEHAFGPVFANTFVSAYTRKYWTREPAAMTTDWIGNRVLYPDVEDVKQGAKGPLNRSMHYINRMRYPTSGGYQSFGQALQVGAQIRYGAEVVSIDLEARAVYLADGKRHEFTRLINTLPLPVFVQLCTNVPVEVVNAARQLSCSQLLLVNVAAPHETQRPEHWIYVYDEDKLSTRINCVEKLSPLNAPKGWSGIQVEVYFSRYRPLTATPEEIGERVEAELIEMGLVVPDRFRTGEKLHRHISYSPWANVIFDHGTSDALQMIWLWLQCHGLIREDDDLHPLSNWSEQMSVQSMRNATIFMAGRFGQWKYFWTDDCVLRGKKISEFILNNE